MSFQGEPRLRPSQSTLILFTETKFPVERMIGMAGVSWSRPQADRAIDDLLQPPLRLERRIVGPILLGDRALPSYRS